MVLALDLDRRPPDLFLREISWLGMLPQRVRLRQREMGLEVGEEVDDNRWRRSTWSQRSEASCAR